MREGTTFFRDLPLEGQQRAFVHRVHYDGNGRYPKVGLGENLRDDVLFENKDGQERIVIVIMMPWRDVGGKETFSASAVSDETPGIILLSEWLYRRRLSSKALICLLRHHVR